MNGLAFKVLFVVGLLASLGTLSLIGLAVCFSLADWRRSRRQKRQMKRLRAIADREWSDEEMVVDVFEAWFARPCAPDPKRRV